MTTVAYGTGGAAGPATTPVSARWRPRLWARAVRATWISHRVALAGLGLVTVAFGVLIAIPAASANAANGRAAMACVGQIVGARCTSAFTTLSKAHTWATFLGLAVLLLPLVAGVFVGAPLVSREVESGSFRFLWTQGVGRARFELRRLVLLGLFAAACACVLGILMGWLLHPLQGLGLNRYWGASENNPWDARWFNSTVLVLPAWTVFTLALGALAGAVVRRTVIAMAGTGVVAGGLLLFAGEPATGSFGSLTTRLVGLDPVVRRLHSAPIGIGGGPGTATGIAPRHSWIVQTWVTSPGGNRYYTTATLWSSLLGRHPAAERRPGAWLAAHHFSSWVSYQPGSRFWSFEAILAAALVIAAALLCWATLRVIRRLG